MATALRRIINEVQGISRVTYDISGNSRRRLDENDSTSSTRWQLNT